MTNEEYIKAIGVRTARRTYRPRFLEDAVMDVIQEMVDYVNESAGLNFMLIRDGTAYFSIFSGRFSVIALCGPDDEKTRIKCGYYGETIVLQCAYHGLGTCWVTGTYHENRLLEDLKLPKELRLYGVITVGYVKPAKSSKEKIMHNVTHKQSKPYQKMFEVCDKKLPEHYVFAMQMVEKAPSSTNRRPVAFRYENGMISASVSEPYSDKSIDFGIAQLHFQLGCQAMGIKGEWDYKGNFIVKDAQQISQSVQKEEEADE